MVALDYFAYALLGRFFGWVMREAEKCGRFENILRREGPISDAFLFDHP